MRQFTVTPHALATDLPSVCCFEAFDLSVITAAIIIKYGIWQTNKAETKCK